MGWITEVTRYERITATRVATKRCVSCDKKFRLQRTVGQTVNPWNKNPDGSAKTRAEVTDAVNAEADTWAAEPLLCLDCATTEVPDGGDTRC